MFAPFLQIIVVVAVLQPVAAQRDRAASPGAAVDEIRARLAEHEKLAERVGRPDPQLLSEIGRMVLDQAARAQDPDVWMSACESSFDVEAESCDKRLRGTLDAPRAPFLQRARAGAALVRRGQKSALKPFVNVLDAAALVDLARAADYLDAMPWEQRRPLLLKLLGANATEARIAGCRAADENADAEVRGALAKAAEMSPPGTDGWFACVIARGRLNEPDARWKLVGMSGNLEGQALLDAAAALTALGDDRGLDLARRTTRLSSGTIQVEAAMLLAESDAEYAAKIADAQLAASDAGVRARALSLERRLNRPPGAKVRAALGDASGIVRVRAAEAVLAWAAREKK